MSYKIKRKLKNAHLQNKSQGLLIRTEIKVYQGPLRVENKDND